MTRSDYVALINKAGLTSTHQASKFFGVSTSTAAKWLATEPSPPVAKLLLLMEALGLSATDVERVIAEGKSEKNTRKDVSPC